MGISRLRLVAAGFRRLVRQMEKPEAVTLIQIHPDDNVGVLAGSVHAGQVIRFLDLETRAAQAFSLGHKFALKAIPAGGKVIKYGVSIGSAIREIAPGEHVHLHNLKSDYLPTYTLENERSFGG
jgi:altronate dehydratase